MISIFWLNSSTWYQSSDSTQVLDINLLTQLEYLISTFWLSLILILSWYQIWVLNSTHQEIENDIKCQDLLFLNLLRHYIWKTYVKQMNLFLFLLFALSCCIINKIYCKMSDSDKTYELSRSLIEKESNFLIVHSFTFSSLYSNEFASQDSQNINQNFVEKKRILQEAMNKIHCNTSLLILRENNQCVEWSADINAQFQQWWLQMFIDESVINKTQRKIDNSLWAKKIKVNKQFNIWNKFIQMISTLKEYSKISCKNCLKILDYSTTIDESSTFNMIKHLKSNACQKWKRLNSLSQLKISFDHVSSIW